MSKILSLIAMIVASCIGLQWSIQVAAAEKLHLPSINMLPPPTVDQSSIAIINFGSVALSISYWNGGAFWKTFQIMPYQSIGIGCGSCEANVAVAFHDGQGTKTVPLKSGIAYALYWDSNEERWSIGKFEEVQRQLARH